MRRNKQACDQCRIKKAKCNSGLPCKACKQNHMRCTYSSPKKKRGIPTGYLQNLEKSTDRLLNLLGIYLESEPNGEQILIDLAVRLASSSGKMNAQYKRHLQNSKILEILDLQEIDLTLIRSGLKKSESKDYRVLASQPITTITKTTTVTTMTTVENSTEKQVTTSLGPSSGFDSLVLSTFQKLQLSKSTFDVKNWKSHLAPFSLTEILDSYFTYIHSILPMVNRTDMIRLIHSDDTSIKSSANVLLWSAVFIAFNQMRNQSHGDGPYETRVMHDLTLCVMECKHSLESVQALLIQAIYFWGQGYWSNAWMIVGNAVRMAVDLGLNVNNSTSNSTSFSVRTWKCCCIIDTLISGRLGRVPQITPEDYFEFDEIETSEEWELWKPTSIGKGSHQCYPEPYRLVSIFNQFHRINKLANIAITQTNKTGYFESTKQDQLKILIETVQSTRKWLSEVPEHIAISDMLSPNASLQLLPHRANLYFGYVSMYLIVYLVSDNNHEGLIGDMPSVEEVATMTINVLSNFTSRFPSNCLPSFEYFSSLCLIIVFKDGLAHERFHTFQEMIEQNAQAKSLLDFLQRLSSTWCGASVAHDYFTKMAKEESQNLVGIDDSSIYSNFMSSMPNFGNISDFDFFGSYRVSLTNDIFWSSDHANRIQGGGIGDLIHRLENGQVDTPINI